MTTDRIFNAPTVVNLEVTELCNAKCVHCYNPWREESMGVNSFDDHKINLVLDKWNLDHFFATRRDNDHRCTKSEESTRGR